MTEDLHSSAWEGVKQSYASGRLAHAYVIVGNPRGNGYQFAESLLKLLFCEAVDRPCNECNGCRKIEEHKQIDVQWVEPRSKSRQILAVDIRDLIKKLSQTSYEGGWKAGVIVSADCMNESSENALLKTLEEPPKKTILLLLTEAPESLLPTIISRCHKVVLGLGRQAARSSWYEPLMELMTELPPQSGLDAARLGAQLKGLLDALKADIADEVETDFSAEAESMEEDKVKEVLDARVKARLKEVQEDIFRVLLGWYRDLLLLAYGVEVDYLDYANEESLLRQQLTVHTPSSALHGIQVIERMASRLDRNIPDTQIFDEGFRQLIRG
jgi:DNA polymerase III subunit delta'